MIDDLLFQRGEILTKIDDEIDDYDNIIADHYFKTFVGLDGEVYDSDGSEYHLVSLDHDDFKIIFTVFNTEFETAGGIISFEEIKVQCTGTIIEIDNRDVLDIKTFYVLARSKDIT